MIQVYKDRPSFAQQLARAIPKAGGEFANAFMQHKIQQRQNEALKRVTGKDLSGLSPEMKQTFFEKFAQTPGNEKVKEALIKQGVDPDEAELYSQLTQGGQTAYVKELLENKKRMGKFSKAIGSAQHQQTRKEELSPEQQEQFELDELISKQDEGLTPAEKVKRSSERYKSGLPIAEEASKKLRAESENKDLLKTLESLNNSKKLPKNLGRLNVNAEGNLRFPFLASPESQRYVKTLNEFSKGAKDTYGARVTNFDLSQFMKRFPTLLNTEEGRRQLLQQMKIVSDINAIYYKNLKNVFDKSGGARNIDADVAQSLAEQKSAPQIEQLVKKFDQIGEFEVLPAASESNGQKFMNEATGEIMISNGEEWLPFGE